MKKKLVSILLSITLICSFIPQNITYLTSYAANNNISVTMYNGNSQDAAKQFILDNLLAPSIKTQINNGNVAIENSKIRYGGSSNIQIGSFTGATGTGVNNILNFNEGVALSTGNLVNGLNSGAASVISKAINSNNYRNDYLLGTKINDPASISFDIVLKDGAFNNGETEKEMILQYAIGSEEYTKYSLGNYNDRFGIIIDGKRNYATVPGTNDQISIATVNQKINSAFFRCNTTESGLPSENLNINLNGLTRTFTSKIKLHKGRQNLKFLIGDYGDSAYDSVLFLKLSSIDFSIFDAGILSLKKENGKVIVNRNKTTNTGSGTDGTISFILVEENLDGEKNEITYTIANGDNKMELPISAEGVDKKGEIPFNTAKVSIKKAEMGATIDQTKKELTLKIPAPKLSKDKDNNKITIHAKNGAKVKLYKKNTSNAYVEVANNLTDGSIYNSHPITGEYYAISTQTLNGETFTSEKSNTIHIIKPPKLIGDFSEVVINKNDTYNNPTVTAVDGAGQDITNSITKTGSVNTGQAGINTITYSVSDSGYTVVKTKIVKVKPEKPTVFKDDYKGSIIYIEGEKNATVRIRDKNNKILATVHLDNNGKGKLIDPPNGSYHASQIVNGVESDNTSLVNINRTYKRPVITLIGEQTINLTFKETNSDSYTEPGAKVSDEEDNKKPYPNDSSTTKAWDSTTKTNSYLTPKVEIDNPMFNKTGKTNTITITSPALNKNGTPTTENSNPFEPFVGKYEVKYTVKDTDDLQAEPVVRLVKVKPYVPTASVEAVNTDSSIKIDALSSASVFLYKEINGNYTPINIVDGKAVAVTNQSDLYRDGKHTRLKMKKGSSLAEKLQDSISGLPDGKYKILQRLYGLNSELSSSVTVKHKDHVPFIKLNGKPTISMVKDTNYTELGAKYTVDGIDKGNVPNSNIDKTNLKTNIIGTYTVTYTATNDSESSTVKRTVIVKPSMPNYKIGDYDATSNTFVENPNGNDIQVSGIENGASVQVVMGSNGQGALYKQKFNVTGGKCIFENLAETDNKAENYGIFQTVNEIQSDKNAPFDIKKTNHMPKLTLKNNQALRVPQGGSLTIKSSDATASDAEDDDATLTGKIEIYPKFKIENDVIKPDGVAKKTINITTATIGDQKFYYAVTDSDGNRVMQLREVEVIPQKPILNVTASTKITVTNLENNALVELFKRDENGKWKLFATKKADASGNDIDFNTLDTGVYSTIQIVNDLESNFSDPKPFANTAYVIAKVVDKNNNPLKDIEFTMEEVDETTQSAFTDETGTLTFTAQENDTEYQLTLEHKNMKLKATSSENFAVPGTKTIIVGKLLNNGKETNFDKNKIKAKVLKKDNGKWVDTTLARLIYNDGIYQLHDITDNQEYKINLGYDIGQKGQIEIAEVMTQVVTANNIKIHNQKLNYGKVTDNTGKALSGVEVTVYRPDRNEQPDYKLGPVSLPTVNGLINSNINGSKTNADGLYGYSVYNNVEYVLVTKKYGYEDKIVVVGNVHGQLLGEDITMQKGQSSLPADTANNNYSDDNIDDSINDSENKAEDVKDEISKPQDNSGLPIIKDVEATPILDNSEKNGDIYENKHHDYVEDGSYAAYQSDSIDEDDNIIKNASKGKIFTNPESGSIIYIPDKHAEGTDSFIIKTQDKNGKIVKVKKNLTVEKQTGKLYGRRNALVLELSANTRKGFNGSTFKIDLDFVNNLSKDVEKATIAVRLPHGFQPTNKQYQVKNGHLIIPVNNLKKDKHQNINFELIAENPDMMLNEIKAVLQQNGSKRIYPEAVSSIQIKVNSTGKRYYAKPYIKGYPDGSFGGNDFVTRAEVAAMLTRCLKNESSSFLNSKNTKFSDVSDKDWYFGYVNQAIRYGLFNGFKDGTFKPVKKISRAELATVIGNYLKINISDAGVVKQPYSDVVNHWARDEINTLYRYGISIGYPDGTFKPDKNISRQETVKMINKMLYRYELPHVESSFHDHDNTHWSFGGIESAYRGYSYELDQGKKLNIIKMK